MDGVFFIAKNKKEKIMKIKKLFLGLALAGIMTGCGKNESKEATPAASNDILADGVLTVATSADFAPYEYYDGKDIVGIDPDILKALGEKLGVEIELKDMDFNNIIASIGSGKADIGAAGLTIDEERLKNVDFTDTYAGSVQIFLVKDDGEINSVEDLEGKKIGSQLGSIGDDLAQKDYDNVSTFAKYPDAVLALQNSKVDAILMDKTSAEKFVNANEGLKIMEGPYEPEEYALALGKDQKDAKEKINAAIKELKEDGTIDEIVKKYK